jgi:dTDP-4-dehydrorhamnose reductase
MTSSPKTQPTPEPGSLPSNDAFRPHPMNVCVLGHRGMLGTAVARFLKESGHRVQTIANRFSSCAADEFIDAVQAGTPDWCVNCIGIAPRQELKLELLTDTNSELPAALSRELPTECGLIHASTDGVFRPDRADRRCDEPTDATDNYGLSKRRAEDALSRPNDFIIRSSLVGIDPPGRPDNLLSWFLGASGDDVSGFANQMWNGITTLQWARFAAELIERRASPPGRILQPAVLPPVSKFDLLNLFGEVWEHPRAVNAAEAPASVTRTLKPNIETPPLREQLLRLKSWTY